MDHIADDWFYAYARRKGMASSAEKLLLHLLVCEQCCQLASLHEIRRDHVLALVITMERHTQPRLAMTVANRAADFLRIRQGSAYCDSCIATFLQIKDVQDATASLAATVEFMRVAGHCAACGRYKLVIAAAILSTAIPRAGSPAQAGE